MTELGVKDEDDEEAVAALTTPLVIISLILLTAPGKQGVKIMNVITVNMKT